MNAAINATLTENKLPERTAADKVPSFPSLPLSIPTDPLSIPTDIEEVKVLARSLARNGRIDEALVCWRRVEELDPYDAEPSRMIPAMTLKKSRLVGTVDGNGEGASEAANDSSAPAKGEPTVRQPLFPAVLPKAPRQLVLTRRQQLEAEIAQRPEDETNYLALAELHLVERRTYDAQRTLVRALEISRAPPVVERLEDVNMLLAKEKVKLAEERTAGETTSEAEELVKKLREESFQLELDVFRNRCFRHPEDKRLKFQLGLRLKQIGNHREALEFLQAGLEFPELRAPASLEIGEVLQRHHLFPKALQCYRQAAQLAAGDDNLTDCRKRALYRAGVLATAMTLTDTARGYLAELVKMSPGYRDAQTRLDKLGEISDTFGFD
jgi:tetratricopeptide (TPR) repeat protein